MAETPSRLEPPYPRRGGWFAMIIVGALLTLVAGPSLASSAALAAWAGADGRDGFLTSPELRVSAAAAAVTSEPLVASSLPDDVFPDIGLTLTAGQDGGAPIFVGVGPSADVDDYLAGVPVAQVRGVYGVPLRVQTRVEPGNTDPSAPAAQDFWVVSDEGPGERDITWNIEPGTWTVVLMNADGSTPVDTTVRVGVEAPWAGPLTAALLVSSLAILTVGLALTLTGVHGWGRDRGAETLPTVGPYPVALSGALRENPSRWLWLVKWILVIPHGIVLSVLWVAFGVTTVATGFAILFTGRYPRSFFMFTVGVLRWTWRVSFYAYSTLGTDRYPPFSLLRTDYPADLEVAYPERLSRGLVLVKWWLLAIPHYLLIGVATGGITWWSGTASGALGFQVGGLSLLSLLVAIAAVILLFSGRYQRPLFDLILGVNRWSYRVISYVALMRDEYPPFRLDQGPSEPSTVSEPSPTSTTSTQ